MQIAAAIVWALVFLLAPSLVMKLCRRYAWAGKVGPVLILYVIGIVLGNLGLIPCLPKAVFHPESLATVQDILSSAMVPVAIPLMLFGCVFNSGAVKGQVKALLTGLVAVVAAVVCGYLIFHGPIDAGGKGSAADIGGMLTGVYTGGTMNLAALKTMLGVEEETYILMNSFDMVVSFLFLTFLLSVGIRMFRRILPAAGPEVAASGPDRAIEPDRPALWSRGWWKQAGILLALTAAIVGVSAGIAAVIPGNVFMTVFILLLTTLGIAASFIPKVRSMKIADDIGMYCIYVFSIVVASMADISALDLAGSLALLGYLAFVVFGSFAIQVILAKIFRIDADTVIICSTAFICSPPFVPMMAAAMKNRNVVIGGLTIGIIGYAAGNYLGFLVSRLLLLF